MSDPFLQSNDSSPSPFTTPATTLSVVPTPEDHEMHVNPSKSKLFTSSHTLRFDPHTGKSLLINIFSLQTPHMRNFHLSWLAFFMAFTGWFAYAPLLKKTVGPNLGMSVVDIANSDISNVAATVAFRVIIGPLVDKLGSSRVMGLVLILGSIPLGLSALSTTPLGIIVSRLFIGILGASFVPCQYWTTAFFASNVVGTANAIAGGWGNMGAGVTYLVMPRIYNLFRYTFGLETSVAWRASMSVPVAILWIIGFLCFRFGDDKPGVEYRGIVGMALEEAKNVNAEEGVLKKRELDHTLSVERIEEPSALPSRSSSAAGTLNETTPSAFKQPLLESPESTHVDTILPKTSNLPPPLPAHHRYPSSRSNQPQHELGASNPEATKHTNLDLLIRCITNPNIIILMFNYACSFGVELSVDGAIGNYFIANFNMDQSTGSLFGALFGLMNLFSRATGGIVSDLAAQKWGARGRIGWHMVLFVVSSGSLVAFSYMTETSWAVVTLIIFSYACQAGCGSTFGIVPFIGPYMGTASGLIGAGGNIGGALFNVMLRQFVGQTRLAFMYMGVTIALGGFLLCWFLVVNGEYLLKPLVDGYKKRTPDSWVPRDPDLIRLTGKFPLNAEPPIQKLMSCGWVTRADVGYIRNHGPVFRPPENAEEFTLKIEGLVNVPHTIRYSDILSMPTTTFACTLVCDGNRRAELNKLKPSRGFPYSTVAAANYVFTGVRLSYLINDICGQPTINPTDHPTDELWVTVEGSDHLPKGTYSSSISLRHALDNQSDVILAHSINGHPLTPDHGFPLRLVVPGNVGGRMVKWVSKIVVERQETKGWYYVNDNRFLPSSITTELEAAEGGWWERGRETVIRELNVNSVITTPGYTESVKIPVRDKDAGGAPFVFKGFAYSGGGRAVVRVELSFDLGKSWHLARVLPYPPSMRPSHIAPRHGSTKFWSWWFWEFSVDDLGAMLGLTRDSTEGKWKLGCRQVAVRAWDSSMNTQPERPTWNLLGMMNNSYYRLLPILHVTSADVIELEITFQHPIVPQIENGWMQLGVDAWDILDAAQRVGAEGSERSNQHKPSEKEEEDDGKGLKEVVDMDQVRQHNSRGSCWIVVKGVVYDVTKFLKDHPGGPDAILVNAGTDSTEDFLAIHSSHARSLLHHYCIARLKDGSTQENSPPTQPATPVQTAENHPPIALNSTRYTPFPLEHKQELTKDTRLLKFRLPFSDQTTGLLPGQHVLIRITQAPQPNPSTQASSKSVVIRAYTPITDPQTRGFFELLIRVYTPPAGRCSRALDALKVGECVDMKGPLGGVVYHGWGKFCVPNDSKEGGEGGKGGVKSEVGESMKAEKERQKTLGSGLGENEGVRGGELRRVGSDTSLNSMSGMEDEEHDERKENLPRLPLCAFPDQRFIRASPLALIAAGTGITPHYQILQTISSEWRKYHDPSTVKHHTHPPPTVKLIYANRTLPEILLFAELNSLVSEFETTPWLHVIHVLSRDPDSTPPSTLPQGVEVLHGHVNSDLICSRLSRDALLAHDSDEEQSKDEKEGRETPRFQLNVEGPRADKDTLETPDQNQLYAFVCGSDAFVQKTCIPGLVAAGYTHDRIFAF
ncbi:hypothetical protein HDV05_008290 [Chytridiales sp. JEL 0842]|nr:hypothetical protein HDV05_008290 [Chytridiales sp. JEL 0842]